MPFRKSVLSGLPDPISGERVAAAVVSTTPDLDGKALAKWMAPLIRKDCHSGKMVLCERNP